MSDDSPLFVSAMELLAHSTELYGQGNERKYKFIILHLSNAVELILKDRLIDHGESIYVPKTPETISIWRAFEKLEKLNTVIPERPIIELLVDDRNTIQHRFGHPNAETTYYYLIRVVGFFNRFLKDEYGIELAEVLKSRLTNEELSIIGLADKGDHRDELDRLFELSPESAIIRGFSILESRLDEVLDSSDNPQREYTLPWQRQGFSALLNDLEAKDYLPKGAVQDFQTLRKMRNYAAHNADNPQSKDREEWSAALKIAKSLLRGLDQAVSEGYLTKPSEESVSDPTSHPD